MKKLLLPIGLGVVGLIGGLAGGHFLKPAPVIEEDAAEQAASKAEIDAAADDAKAQIERDLAQYETEGRKRAPTIEEQGIVYHKMTKQFVVPVVVGERVRSLMVIDLALRINEGSGEAVFNHEPKLRDEFLQDLFIHAQSEGFSSVYQKPNVLADLRAAPLQSAKSVLGDLVHEILITNIVRKDV